MPVDRFIRVDRRWPPTEPPYTLLKDKEHYLRQIDSIIGSDRLAFWWERKKTRHSILGANGAPMESFVGRYRIRVRDPETGEWVPTKFWLENSDGSPAPLDSRAVEWMYAASPNSPRYRKREDHTKAVVMGKVNEEKAERAAADKAMEDVATDAGPRRLKREFMEMLYPDSHHDRGEVAIHNNPLAKEKS